MSLIERIVKAGEGEVATISPTWIVVNDGPGARAIQDVRSVRNAERTLVFYDHLVPTGSSDDAEVFKCIRGFADKYGLPFYQAKGIGYLYMMDHMTKEGDIVIEASRHSAIFGAGGIYGIDVSPIELARVIETGRYSMVVPKACRVKIIGSLSAGSTAMDLGLQLLKTLGSRKGFSLEIESSLPVCDNTVIASILSHCNADAVLFGTLDGKADLEVDASATKPLVMLPCESFAKQDEAEIEETGAIEGITFNAGMIGGYTAGRIECLREVRDMIRGHKLRLGFRLSISPATSDDYLKALEEGIIADFIDYGAQILPPADHSIVKQGAGAMGVDEKLITTGLYTFSGSMGLESANVYSASHVSVICRSWE